MRLALGVEYAGDHFHGWQFQPHAASVQAKVEQAVSFIADHPVRLICAGRTDTGVHATAQVCHFDTEAIRPEHSWRLGINSRLPDSVRVSWVKPTSEDFHARFSATSRRYRYIILNRANKSAILNGKVTPCFPALNAKHMHAAAQYLVGKHDFDAYRTVHCQAKSPIRTMHAIVVHRSGEFIYVDLHANAFLHHMVRNIVGVLLSIGQGLQPVDWTQQVLLTRDRTQGGMTALPDGLYLTHIDYPQHFAIPAPISPPFYG